MHYSLKFKFNIFFLVGILSIAIFTNIIYKPFSIELFIISSLLGVYLGVIQSFSIKRNPSFLKKSETALEVRKNLINSKFGKLYIYSLHIAYIFIFLIAICLKSNLQLTLVSGFSVMIFCRDIITLYPIFKLNQ